MAASLPGANGHENAEAPGRSPPGLVTHNSNQRAGNGSGVVVMSARCMPVTVAPGPRPPHHDLPRAVTAARDGRPARRGHDVLEPPAVRAAPVHLPAGRAAGEGLISAPRAGR